MSADLIQWWETGIYTSPQNSKLSKTSRNYADAKIEERSTKVDANIMFSDAMMDAEKGMMDAEKQCVVYLDTEKANTTKSLGTLKATKIPVNFDAAVYRALVNENFSNTAPRHDSMYQALKVGNRMSGFWGDYCSTMAGNESCVPTDDMAVLFDKKVNTLAKGAIVAWTFCMRDRRLKGKFQDAEEHRDVVQQTIVSVASHGGYSLELMRRRAYHPSMLYLQFKVC